MIKLYGIALSNNVNKVRYCLDYLKLQYEYSQTNPLQGETQTPQFQALTPTGKIPALEIDGISLFESNAMIRYLAKREKSAIYPQDIKKAALVDAWMDFGSIHIGSAVGRILSNRIFAPMMNKPVDQNSLQFGLEMMAKYLPQLDKQLQATPFVAGSEFTIADISVLATLDPCEIVQVDLTPFKNVMRWRTDLKSKDFYQKASKDNQAFIQTLMAKK